MFAAISRWARLLVVAAVVVSSAGNLAAQGAATASTSKDKQPLAPRTGDLVFKTSVRRVMVDVVVSDSLGRPVSGLTAHDFKIAEDGKPQTIRFFDVHDFDPVSNSLPALPASLPANTFLNIPKVPERGPLYVLLLDLLNMEIADQATARKQLLEFIRNKPEGTRFAVYVLSDRLYQVQGFTEDRNVLADAVDPKNPHSRIPKIFLYADNYRPYISTPGVLASIGAYLADLPGHKNLIWFSGSFPSSIMPSSDPGTEALSVNDQIQEAVNILARARIAVYPVDVKGAVSTAPDANMRGGPAANNAGTAADQYVNAGYMTEAEIARSTGGRAFYGTNDLVGALTAATETGGRYYTLTYSPSNPNYEGRLRRINVELAKPGCRLEYRRSYYATPNWARKETAREKRGSADLEPLAMSRPSDSLYPNMQHGAPMSHQLLFRAHIQTLSKATREQMEKVTESTGRRKDTSARRERPGKLQTYQIDYTIAARYPLLEIAVAAYDDDGKILNSAIQRVIEETSALLPGKTGGAIYRVQQMFDVPVNAASVRLAVRDVATDNVGALEIKLPLAAVTKPSSEQGPVPASQAMQP